MLTAYFDDSGTHSNSEVAVFGGLLGMDEKHWPPFEAAWKAKLRQPLPGKPSLTRFHMTDCVARQGEFIGYTPGEVDAVVHDFRQIILDADLYGYSCAVSLSDWDNIVGVRSYEGLKDPEFFCMSTAIIWACKMARTYSQQVKFVFDDMPAKRAANLHIFSMYHQGHNMNVGQEEIIGISFMSSEEFVGLQGADMVAWETYDHAKKWLKDGTKAPTRPHLTSLATSGRFIAHIAGPRAIEEIREWLERLQNDA